MSKTRIELFEYANQQSLKGELIQADEGIISTFNLDYRDWCELFKGYNLNPNNVYLQKSNVFSKLFYLGEYVATEVIPDIEILKSEWAGLSRVTERDSQFKKMFEEKEYSMVFYGEFNPMALYYFIKHYKKIEKEQLYDVFIDLYQNISYGFAKMPQEIYEEVFKLPPSRDDVVERLKEDIGNIVTEETELTIYRGVGEKSTPKEQAYSWTLSYEVAKRFAEFCDGDVLQAKTRVKDIIDYLGGGEQEVLVRYSSLTEDKTR